MPVIFIFMTWSTWLGMERASFGKAGSAQSGRPGKSSASPPLARLPWLAVLGKGPWWGRSPSGIIWKWTKNKHTDGPIPSRLPLGIGRSRGDHPLPLRNPPPPHYLTIPPILGLVLLHIATEITFSWDGPHLDLPCWGVIHFVYRAHPPRPGYVSWDLVEPCRWPPWEVAQVSSTQPSQLVAQGPPSMQVIRSFGLPASAATFLSLMMGGMSPSAIGLRVAWTPTSAWFRCRGVVQ